MFSLYSVRYCITANFPQMCLMQDQFLRGHSSRDCDILVSLYFEFHLVIFGLASES